MYIYFDVNGNLKEMVQVPIREGSFNANTLYIYVEGELNGDTYELPNRWSAGKINFALLDSNINLNPSGSWPLTKVTNIQIPQNNKRDLYYFKYGYKYEMWSIQLSETVLSVNGVVTGSAYLYSSTEQLALDKISFNVQSSVGITFDNTITDSQYSYLYNQIALIDSDRVATKEWVENQHYLTSATYDYASSLSDLLLKLSEGKKFIVLASDFEAEVSQQISVPSGTIIVGNGGTFTRQAGYEGPIFWMNEGSEICNIIIDGNRSEMVSPTWDTTIEIAAFGDCYIHNVQMIDGNEGILAYGDFNRIEHCKFTNMGGNAIHFSGGKHTVVDDCHVNGANKRSGMGHEDGCIVWSDECEYISCTNNYVEDGKFGFGSIDAKWNSHVFISNNTIKNCINSFDLDTASDPATDIIIQGNIIINSGTMRMQKTSSYGTAQARYLIYNNIFDKSYVEISRYDNVCFNNNVMFDGRIRVVYCTNIKIENNVIKDFSESDSTLTCGECMNVSILDNYVRGNYSVINCYASTSVLLANNKVRAYSSDATKFAIKSECSKNAEHNEIVSYCNGFEIDDYANVVNNKIILSDATKNALVEYGGSNHSLVAFNRSNGIFSLQEGTGNVNSNNMSGADDATFYSVTHDLDGLDYLGFSTVFAGDDVYAVLSVESAGYHLPDEITVTVGGNQIFGKDEYYYDKLLGQVIVFGVTGNVVITASVEQD